eukprot:jgi/Botrbrau1/14287/Bobra.0369s0001.1
MSASWGWGLQEGASVPRTPLLPSHKVVRPSWRRRGRQDVEAGDGFLFPKKTCRVSRPAEGRGDAGLCVNRYDVLGCAGEGAMVGEEVEAAEHVKGNGEGHGCAAAGAEGPRMARDQCFRL